jgi:hypothetical protein
MHGSVSGPGREEPVTECRRPSGAEPDAATVTPMSELAARLRIGPLLRESFFPAVEPSPRFPRAWSERA